MTAFAGLPYAQQPMTPGTGLVPASDTLERAVLGREDALNRERILRSAVEETLRECSPHAGVTVSWLVLADRLGRIQSICQGAVDALEAHA